MSVCYDAILTTAEIKVSTTVALEAVDRTLGKWAFISVAVLVSISVLGSLNASIMTGGRLFFAGARDGDLPAVMATLSKGAHAPYVALLGQCSVVTVLLLLPGSSFNNLVAYFGSASWLWYGCTGLCLLKLRRDWPNADRPYRCPLPCAWLIMLLAAYLIGSSVLDPSTRYQTLTSIVFVSLAFFGYFCYQCVQLRKAPQAAE